MDAKSLRELQAPLKERYKAEPASALVDARGEARPGPELSAVVTVWNGETVAGLHPATGGDGTQACSADMLLEALVACAGVTLSSVATILGVDVEGSVVRATGTWDARGTLGVSREAPVGLTDIRLIFDLNTDADSATQEKLVALTERYCVIFQTLRNPPTVELE